MKRAEKKRKKKKRKHSIKQIVGTPKYVESQNKKETKLKKKKKTFSV